MDAFLAFVISLTVTVKSEDAVNSTAIEEGCIKEINATLAALDGVSSEQLWQSFAHIASVQLHGKPLTYRNTLDRSVHLGLAVFEECGQKSHHVPCLQDLTLPAAPTDQRYLFAANFRNNAELLPHFITQMLTYIGSTRNSNVVQTT